MPSRSLGDDEAWVRAHLWRYPNRSNRVAPYVGPASWVRCPGCGHQVAANTVLDLRGVDAHPKDGLCDGCRHRTHHDPESPWTHASLHQAAGMAWEHVRTLLAREAAHFAYLEHRDQECVKPFEKREPFCMAEARREAHRAAGSKRRDLVNEHHHHGELVTAALAKGRAPRSQEASSSDADGPRAQVSAG